MKQPNFLNTLHTNLMYLEIKQKTDDAMLYEAFSPTFKTANIY